MTNNEIIEKFKEYIQEWIDNLDCSSVLKKGFSYTLISNGKYIRPLLFLTYIQDCGLNIKSYFNYALAIEMIHTYSLIHDDLPALDDDDLRRGLPSCHKKFGEDIAILIGDGLLTNSFELLVDNKNVNSETSINIIKKFSKYCGIEGMVDGQVKDIQGEVLCIKDIKDIHSKKTSMLISFCLESASLIVGDNRENSMSLLGKKLGIYYQIQDDYLDLYGNDKIGKTIGKDKDAGKKTYTYFYNQSELEKLLEKEEKYIEGLLDKKKVNFNKIINKIMKREQ